MGNEYNVSEITEVLGVIPKETWNIGDTIRNTKRKRTYTAWIFSIEAEEIEDINTQIEKMKAIFLPKTDKLCKIKEQYNLDFSIDIVINIEKQLPPAIYFENSLIQFVAKIGAILDIDTYIN
ncbi:MAG: DUF4279 domain-containing protein [Lachnospiraceae bacterium]|nr:DUF4279 domain-containing protein [Lachnospiraceae bacterium]